MTHRNPCGAMVPRSRARPHQVPGPSRTALAGPGARRHLAPREAWLASWQRDGTPAGRDARRVDLVRRRRDRPRGEGSRSDPSAPSNLHRQPERLHAGSFRYDGDLRVAARRGGGRHDAHQGLSVGALAGHPRYSRLDPERDHHALHGRALHLLPDGGRSEGAAGAPLPSSAGATKARPVAWDTAIRKVGGHLYSLLALRTRRRFGSRSTQASNSSSRRASEQRRPGSTQGACVRSTQTSPQRAIGSGCRIRGTRTRPEHPSSLAPVPSSGSTQAHSTLWRVSALRGRSSTRGYQADNRGADRDGVSDSRHILVFSRATDPGPGIKPQAHKASRQPLKT